MGYGNRHLDRIAAALLVVCVSSSVSAQSVELGNATPQAAASAPAAAEARLPTGVLTGIATPLRPQDDYKIGPQDLIEINVFQAKELSMNTRVSSSGFISMPLLGPVRAGGFSATELEGLIAKALEEKYLQNPQVSVFIKEFTIQRVTLEGFVRNPGIYPLKGATSLMQAIALSGGVDATLADTKEIRVFRGGAADRKMMVYNLEEIRIGKLADPTLQADDVVVVDSSSGKVFWKHLREVISISPFKLF
jgi:polysaccharide biosynthesis/export protein